MRREEVVQALVLVLVDEQDPKLPMGLLLERCKQAPELLDSADRGDDKVESHGRTLTPVPLVSVLMSVHDDVAYVDAAVRSVLRQTLADLELLVVDDASTDGTSERLSAYDGERVRVLRNDERSGLAAALNRGLEFAQGRYVARLDADDVALPDRLDRQVAHIRSDPRLAVVGSAVRDLDEHDAVGQ